MAIDAIRQTGIALRVGGWHIVDADRCAIWQDDPLPDDKSAALSEGHDIVITADQSRALRDEQGPSGYAVIGILGDLCRHHPRKIGVQARDQACSNNAIGRRHRRYRACRPPNMVALPQPSIAKRAADAFQHGRHRPALPRCSVFAAKPR